MCVQAPRTVMQPDLSATVYINYAGTNNSHATLEASTTRDMQDNHQLVIHMQTFIATDNSNSKLHTYNYLIIVVYFLPE
jgi:hypothetical protein